MWVQRMCHHQATRGTGMKIRRGVVAVIAFSLALGASAIATGAGAGAAKKAPQVKVILLAETKGESSFAVPYYADGMQMAADELGSKVSFQRIAAPLTPDAA